MVTESLWLAPAALAAATGWARKTEGLCRGEVCVPVDLHPGIERADGRVDVARLAAATGGLLVLDADEDVGVLGPDAATRAAALAPGGPAPDFTLPDLDGRPVGLADRRGTKTLVVAFASWCGCRHDLPAWQALHDELAGDGFGVVTVAIDEDPEAVRPFTEGVDIPVLLDADRAFATDLFRDYHKVDSAPHQAALRRWVHDDVAPGDGNEDGDDRWVPSDGEQAAHLR